MAFASSDPPLLILLADHLPPRGVRYDGISADRRQRRRRSRIPSRMRGKPGSPRFYADCPPGTTLVVSSCPSSCSFLRSSSSALSLLAGQSDLAAQTRKSCPRAKLWSVSAGPACFVFKMTRAQASCRWLQPAGFYEHILIWLDSASVPGTRPIKLSAVSEILRPSSARNTAGIRCSSSHASRRRIDGTRKLLGPIIRMQQVSTNQPEHHRRPAERAETAAGSLSKIVQLITVDDAPARCRSGKQAIRFRSRRSSRLLISDACCSSMARRDQFELSFRPFRARPRVQNDQRAAVTRTDRRSVSAHRRLSAPGIRRTIAGRLRLLQRGRCI